MTAQLIDQLPAIFAIVALTVALVIQSERVASVQRQAAREREQLLARMMHLADKTWEPPPSRESNGTPVEAPSYHFGDDAPIGN